MRRINLNAICIKVYAPLTPACPPAPTRSADLMPLPLLLPADGGNAARKAMLDMANMSIMAFLGPRKVRIAATADTEAELTSTWPGSQRWTELASVCR